MAENHEILSKAQKRLVLLAIIFLGLLTYKYGWATWATILFAVHVYFLFAVVYKAKLALNSLKNSKIAWKFPERLPKYSIIVPLYKEANMIAKICKNLQKIKYPHDLIEIFIVVEEDDLETAEAYRFCIKPSYFRLCVVPKSYPGPKTKPRACNYVLDQISGEIVTIYDAEDAPEPWQLIKAVSLFEQSPKNVACLQASLNYFNYKENLLTRLFAIEYTLWFWFLVPGLSNRNLPIPLGGTSNHFKTSVLRAMGGWNPYNVTEDAEIGIRLSANGYDTKYLPSHTLEEAVSRVYPWIKQRTRWTKGYMQTWLAYSRSGTNLYKSRGVNAGIVMSLFVLGTPLCALLTIPLYFIFFSWLLFDPWWVQKLFPTPLYWQISWICLFGGNFISIISAWYAVWRVGGKKLSFFSVFLPLYWILHSVAAWRALWQLFTNPYKWEKTVHYGIYKMDNIGDSVDTRDPKG